MSGGDLRPGGGGAPGGAPHARIEPDRPDDGPVNLGPFGSSHAGSPALYIWAVFYLALTALLATVVFARRDL